MGMRGRAADAAGRWVAMTVAVYRALLWVCPRGLRVGFGDEMTQTLRHLCRDTYAAGGEWGVMRLWVAVGADLLVGAGAEYVTVLASLWREGWMMNRVRSSAITVFCAYVAFIVAGMGYQKMTEDIIKAGVQDRYPTLGVAFVVVEVGAGIALLATVVGGAPLAWRRGVGR